MTDLDSTQQRMNPSPFNYSIPHKIGKRGNSPEFTCSRRINTQQYTGVQPDGPNLPDPSSYSIPSKMGGKAAFTMSSRNQVIQDKPTPAPNVYQIAEHERVKLSSFSGRTYLPHLFPQKWQPSPDSYNSMRRAFSPKSSLSGRSQFMSVYKIDETADNRAPNSYSILKPCGSDSPKFSLKSRRSAGSGLSVPGPGAYDVKHSFADHGITLGIKAKVRGVIFK